MKNDGIDISKQTSNNINEYNNWNLTTLLPYVITQGKMSNFSQNAIRTHHAFFDPSSIKNPKLIDSAFEKCREEIKLFCKEFSEKYFS